jgi:hypothetical protein
MRTRLAIALLTLAAAACSSVETVHIDGSSHGINSPLASTLERLAPNAAGFYKARPVRYNSGISAYTVAYARFDAELDNVVTLYMYQPSPDAPDLLQIHIGDVFKTYADAQVTERGTASIRQRDSVYAGQYVSFQYFGELNGLKQEVWSYLLVAPLPDRVFVVRSTAPVARGSVAERKLLQLLHELAWTR